MCKVASAYVGLAIHQGPALINYFIGIKYFQLLIPEITNFLAYVINSLTLSNSICLYLMLQIWLY